MDSQLTTAEERISYLSEKAIPSAMDSLAGRHDSLTQVVQYLEQNYATAGSDKADIEGEANAYLVSALTTVAKDIESVAANLEHLVDLNVGAVDSLSTQVDIIQARLRMSKESKGRDKLRSAKIPVTQEREPVTRQLSDVPYPKPYERTSMAKRLSELDDVGVCLNKGAAAEGFTSSSRERIATNTTRVKMTESLPRTRGPSVATAAAAASNTLTAEEALVSNVGGGDGIDESKGAQATAAGAANPKVTGKAGTARAAFLGNNSGNAPMAPPTI